MAPLGGEGMMQQPWYPSPFPGQMPQSQSPGQFQPWYPTMQMQQQMASQTQTFVPQSSFTAQPVQPVQAFTTTTTPPYPPGDSVSASAFTPTIADISVATPASTTVQASFTAQPAQPGTSSSPNEAQGFVQQTASADQLSQPFTTSTTPATPTGDSPCAVVSTPTIAETSTSLPTAAESPTD